MIGQLRNERVEIYGIRSGYGLRQLVSDRNRISKLALDFTPARLGQLN